MPPVPLCGSARRATVAADLRASTGPLHRSGQSPTPGIVYYATLRKTHARNGSMNVTMV
jgi:hypothetical protein